MSSPTEAFPSFSAVPSPEAVTFSRPESDSPIDSILRAYEDRSDNVSFQGSFASTMRCSGNPGTHRHGPTREAPMGMATDQLPQHQARQLLHHSSKPWLTNRRPARRPSDVSFNNDGSSIASSRCFDGSGRARLPNRSHAPTLSPGQYQTHSLPRGPISQLPSGTSRMQGPYPELVSCEGNREHPTSPMPSHSRSDGNLRYGTSRQARMHQIPPLPPYARHPSLRRVMSPAITDPDRASVTAPLNPSLASRSSSVASSRLPRARHRPQYGNSLQAQMYPERFAKPSTRKNREHGHHRDPSRYGAFLAYRPDVSMSPSPSAVQESDFWDYSEGYMDVVNVYAADSTPERSRSNSRVNRMRRSMSSPIYADVSARAIPASHPALLPRFAVTASPEELESPKPMASPRTVQKRLSAWAKDPEGCIETANGSRSARERSPTGKDEIKPSSILPPADKIAGQLRFNFQRVTDNLARELALKRMPTVGSTVDDAHHVQRPSTAPENVSTSTAHGEATKITASYAHSAKLRKRPSDPKSSCRAKDAGMSFDLGPAAQSLEIQHTCATDTFDSTLESAVNNHTTAETVNANSNTVLGNDTLSDLAVRLPDVRVEGTLGSLTTQYGSTVKRPSQKGMCLHDGSPASDPHLRSLAADTTHQRTQVSESFRIQDGHSLDHEEIASSLQKEGIGRPDSETIPSSPRRHPPPQFPLPPLPHLGFDSPDILPPGSAFPHRIGGKMIPELSDVTEESTVHSNGRSGRFDRYKSKALPGTQHASQAFLQEVPRGLKRNIDKESDSLEHTFTDDLGPEDGNNSDASVMRMDARLRDAYASVDDAYTWQEASGDQYSDPIHGVVSHSMNTDPDSRDLPRFQFRLTHATGSTDGSEETSGNVSSPASPYRRRKPVNQQYETMGNLTLEHGQDTSSVGHRKDLLSPHAASHPLAGLPANTAPPMSGSHLAQKGDRHEKDKPPEEGGAESQQPQRQIYSQRLERAFKSSREHLRKIYKSSSREMTAHDNVHEAVDRLLAQQKRRNIFQRLKQWLERSFAKMGSRRRAETSTDLM